MVHKTFMMSPQHHHFTILSGWVGKILLGWFIGDGLGISHFFVRAAKPFYLLYRANLNNWLSRSVLLLIISLLVYFRAPLFKTFPSLFYMIDLLEVWPPSSRIYYLCYLYWSTRFNISEFMLGGMCWLYFIYRSSFSTTLLLASILKRINLFFNSTDLL